MANGPRSCPVDGSRVEHLDSRQERDYGGCSMPAKDLVSFAALWVLFAARHRAAARESGEMSAIPYARPRDC